MPLDLDEPKAFHHLDEEHRKMPDARAPKINYGKGSRHRLQDRTTYERVMENALGVWCPRCRICHKEDCPRGATESTTTK